MIKRRYALKGMIKQGGVPPLRAKSNLLMMKLLIMRTAGN
jgi:hypothetical protein